MHRLILLSLFVISISLISVHGWNMDGWPMGGGGGRGGDGHAQISVGTHTMGRLSGGNGGKGGSDRTGNCAGGTGGNGLAEANVGRQGMVWIDGGLGGAGGSTNCKRGRRSVKPSAEVAGDHEGNVEHPSSAKTPTPNTSLLKKPQHNRIARSLLVGH